MKKLLFLLTLTISLNLFPQSKVKIQTRFNQTENNHEIVLSPFDYSKFVRDINQNFSLIKKENYTQLLKHNNKEIWLVIIYTNDLIIYSYHDSIPNL